VNELVVVSHVVIPAKPAQSEFAVQMCSQIAVVVLVGTHIAPAMQSTFAVHEAPSGNVPARWQLLYTAEPMGSTTHP
jgi:hypothetical protein